MRAHQAVHAVRTMARVLGVSPAAITRGVPGPCRREPLPTRHSPLASRRAMPRCAARMASDGSRAT